MSKVEKTEKTIVIGGKPSESDPADPAAFGEWAATVEDNPMPIKYSLRPLSALGTKDSPTLDFETYNLKTIPCLSSILCALSVLSAQRTAQHWTSKLTILCSSFMSLDSFVPREKRMLQTSWRRAPVLLNPERKLHQA